MTAKDINKFLEIHYSNAKYTMSNVYFFGHPYSETDFLVIQDKGYIYDIEVKISRGDFAADFKKVSKHSILEKGNYTAKYKYPYLKEDGTREWVNPGDPIPHKRPNRFYYCVPEGLVSKNEVPKYAGLLYVKSSGVIEKIKEAPLLTKEKIDYAQLLMNKFYYSYKDLRKYKEENGFTGLNKMISFLEKENEALHKQLRELETEFIRLKYKRQKKYEN